ncbi:DoxX family protein [Caulobacter soli]|uniref:DoxX family protein n=1 Tax=Caulobacter soli TaxID=2708539 RepID=UPI0013EC51F3|nr:DoxX family protein [Caulobacter soli]
MSAEAASTPPRPNRLLSVALWIVQGLLAVAFVGAGFLKLTTPVARLSLMMPWAGDHPHLVLFTGVVDMAGGLGVLLPAATRIKPRLGVAAALGLVVLQTLALAFHLSRGETSLAPANVVLLALSIFVLWGRGWAAPIDPR